MRKVLSPKDGRGDSPTSTGGLSAVVWLGASSSSDITCASLGPLLRKSASTSSRLNRTSPQSGPDQFAQTSIVTLSAQVAQPSRRMVLCAFAKNTGGIGSW